MVETRDLIFSYSGSQEFRFPDVSLGQKEQLLIIGPSGVGKTTFLHLLAGLIRPVQGTINIGQEDITKMGSTTLDKYRGSNIGLVFQKPHFVKSLTVNENLLLLQKIAGLRKDQGRIDELLSRLDIADKKRSKTFRLSQGQQQRLSIAMALLNKPKVILADEPTSSLDDQNCEKVYQLLTEQAQQDEAALIIITHDKRLAPHFKNIISL
jgi:putative ABC transport system ATP-binding protein